MVNVSAFRVEEDAKHRKQQHSSVLDVGGLEDADVLKTSTSSDEEDYSRVRVIDIVKARSGWLAIFVVGLLVSAVVVQRFSDLLEHHVQLSFFVPLIMGHGGNTGSQTVTTVIRALALKQVPAKDFRRVLWKETVAGGCTGAIIGLAVLVFSVFWPDLKMDVGITVALALPIVSVWAGLSGAALTLLADRMRMDPAVTSVPLMTTLVDATGLIIYFYLAELIMDVDLHAAHTHLVTPLQHGVQHAAQHLPALKHALPPPRGKGYFF